MTLLMALAVILVIAVAAGALARSRAGALRSGGRLNSLPTYHGLYAGMWAAIPALLILAAWAPVQTRLVNSAVIASPEGRALPADAMLRDTILGEASDIAAGRIETGFNPDSNELAPRIREADARYGTLGGAAAILAALAGVAFAYRHVKIDFRARSSVERWVMGLLLAASLVAILTTFGIVLSLLFESLRFFKLVSPTEFLFGTT